MNQVVLKRRLPPAILPVDAICAFVVVLVPASTIQAIRASPWTRIDLPMIANHKLHMVTHNLHLRLRFNMYRDYF
jgi:hypothetical protein